MELIQLKECYFNVSYLVPKVRIQLNEESCCIPWETPACFGTYLRIRAGEHSSVLMPMRALCPAAVQRQSCEHAGEKNLIIFSSFLFFFHFA